MRTPVKALILLAFALGIGNNLNAQYQKQGATTDPDFKNAFGIRFGPTSGITYKHKFSSYNAMEIILGTYPHAIGVTGLYERYFLTNVDGLNFYLGAGAHIARGYYSSWGYSYNPDKDQYYYYTRSYHYGPVLGIDAIGGAEYKFQNVPVALSLDFKPYAEFYRGNGPYTRLDPGLGVKFTF
jgi:hypothetical protein